MTDQSTALPTVVTHGPARLPSVDVDSYNAELKDDEGFLGDRASKGAFRAIIENWRKPLRKAGDDPFGEEPSEDISKKKLDDPAERGRSRGGRHRARRDRGFRAGARPRHPPLPQAQGLARHRAHRVGGGFRDSRVGELAIGRAAVILKADEVAIELVPIRNDPDEAGLIGAAHLAPRWMFEAHDAILAVDIGGTNIRAGVVALNLKKAADLSKADVWKFELWRHGDEEDVKRDDAVERLVGHARGADQARRRRRDCSSRRSSASAAPASSSTDGSIDRGAQNLPGNWESSRFNLPAQPAARRSRRSASTRPLVVMHNDAVVQGLSEVPFMQDVERWGVLTIGTGLGNARFTNR